MRVKARLLLNDVFVALKDVIPHRRNPDCTGASSGVASPACRSRAVKSPSNSKSTRSATSILISPELCFEGGKGFLYVVVDRTSKLVFARIYRKTAKLIATAFLRVLVKAMPYKIHTILTDNGVQFIQRNEGGIQGWIGHIFGRVCGENGIEHRLTKPDHPWTNGQAERMVRTIKSNPSIMRPSTSYAGTPATG